MQINISTRHGHLSDASQAKITSKVGKLNRFFERLTSIEVTINIENSDAPSVDLRVSAEHKHDFVATVTGKDLMGAVDGVVHKLEQQLRKYKEKLQQHHRSPAVRQGETGTEDDAVNDFED